MINSGILDVLMLALHKADTKLAMHSKRVSCYACEMAKELGQSAEFRRQVLLAGLVHDVGFLKLDVNFSQTIVDTSVLRDYELIKTHAEEGSALMAKIISDEAILNMVRHHHEKFNGEGYPDGLKGDAISLGARVIAVADLYDSMMIGESFGEQRSVPQDVLHYFTHAASGSEVDPDIVKVFLALLEKNPVFYMPVENNDMRLYKMIYLTPGKLELGDLCNQNGSVLVKQGAELTQAKIDNLRTNYPGQKIIYVPEPDK